MNYIDMINSFWKKSRQDDLKGNDIAVYFALLDYCNRLSWQNPFICHWDIICQTSKVSKNTYYNSVKKLDSLGYVKYTKGKRNVSGGKIVILKLKNNKRTEKEQQGNKKGITREQNEEQQGNLIKPLNKETNKPINNKQPPKPKKVFSQDVFDCYYSILPHFDESTKPKENQVDSWLDTIEKLNRIDGYDFNDIIHLVSKTREDTFWQSNFLSINKLRQKNKDGITYWNVFYNKFKQTNNNNSSYDINELIRRKLEDPTL